jgi:hypothetical protein
MAVLQIFFVFLQKRSKFIFQNRNLEKPAPFTWKGKKRPPVQLERERSHIRLKVFEWQKLDKVLSKAI